VAGSLGFCGLDRRRQPLVGDEIRACWEAWPGIVDLAETITPSQPLVGPSAAEPRDFVEVGVRPAVEVPAATGEVAPIVLGPVPMPAIGEPGWSLWGDVEG
jgi:hypothetical protein